MLLALFDPSEPVSIFSAILQWGPGGVVALMFIFRWVDPKGVRQELTLEKETWKEAFQKEQLAHQVTREALAKAEERADVAMDIAKPLTSMLHALGHAPGDRGQP